MEWREAGGVRWLEASLPGATAVFSTRSAGSLRESHARLAAALGISPDRVVSGRQVHGAELAFHDGAVNAPAEVDGHVISAPGLARPRLRGGLPAGRPRRAGWGRDAPLRLAGLGSGDRRARRRRRRRHAAAIGPGIGPCCYEVGDEVLETFAGLGQGAASGRMLDLPEVARLLLRQAGVEEVELAGLCTCCEEDLFFSHRRDGGPGRQAGLVWLGEGEG